MVIFDAIELLAYDEAEYWFDWMATGQGLPLHWSDHYQRAKLLLVRGRAARCLTYIADFASGRPNHFINVLKGAALKRCGQFAELAHLDINLYQQPEKIDLSHFPAQWIPNVKDEKRIRARLLCMRGEGRTKQNAEDPALFPDASNDFSSAHEMMPRCVTACQMLFGEPRALLAPPQRSATDLHESFKRDNNVWRLFDNEQYAATIECIETRWRSNPPSRVVPIYANSLLFANEKLKLFHLAQRCVKECPDEGTTWYAVGLHYCGQGKEEDMRKYWLKGLSKDDSCVECWIGLGHSYGQAGDHDLAVNAYMAAAHHYAIGSPWPRLFLASEYIRCRKSSLAEPLLNGISSWIPNNPLFLNEYAVCKAQLRDYRESIGCIEAALRSDNLSGSLRHSLLLNRIHILLASIADQDVCNTSSSLSKILEETRRHCEALHTTCPSDPKVLKVRAFCAELCHRLAPKSKDLMKQAIVFHEQYLNITKDKWAGDQLERLRSIYQSPHPILPPSSSTDLTRYLPSSPSSSPSVDDMEIDNE